MKGKLIVFVEFIVLCLLIFGLSSVNAESVRSLRAVRGRTARLPCGQGMVFLDGPDAYVLWLKDDNKFLHSNRSFDEMGCILDVNVGCGDNSTLVIKAITDADAGMYRCRVHMQGGPAIDHVIEVVLIDFPGTPRIYNEDKEEIVKGYLGPLNLGADFTLICEVDVGDALGNDDRAVVFWRRNSAFQDSVTFTNGRTIRSVTTVTNISRNELDAHYECIAQNADITDALVHSIVVKMYLPPLKVEIRLNNNVNFEAGQPRLVDCIVIGCVPPPSITWHLDHVLLKPTSHKEIHEGNYTVSTLSLTPSIGIMSRKLRCRAHNPHLPKHMYQETLTIHIGHRPVCAAGITVIAKSEPDDRNGQTETVLCQVEAMPEPMQFIWTLPDSKTLVTSVNRVPDSPHLFTSTLTWLPRRNDYGILTCRAYNMIGEQKSPCQYAMSQPTPPQTPHCLLNMDDEDVAVVCRGEWNPGNPQLILLQVLDESGIAIYNESNSYGEFQLPKLPTASKYLTVKVYAENSKGTSAAVFLHWDHVIETTTVKSDEEDDSLSLYGRSPYSYVWVIITSGLGFLFVMLTMLFVFYKKRQSRLARNPDLVPSPDGAFHREPELERDEPLDTSVTLRDIPSCKDRFTSSPLFCRVRIGYNGHQDNCCQSLAAKQNPKTYYV